jgi:alkanesulfonate monooxygenase SsuD/methylene tetrahydromethanopterin reductase-like flavin-dependent oxidoreductase (luciferase family)
MKAGMFYLFETLGEKSPAQAYKEAVEEAVFGEKLGFYAVCPAEHHFAEHYGIMPDTLDFLSWVAARTKKIKLWPMVIVAPLNEPIRLAERVAMLDQFSEGRVVFSVGSGYRAYEFTPFGLDIKDNWRIMRESIEFCTKVWTNGKVSYEGEFIKVKDVEIQPKPFQKPFPPVYITTTRDDQIRWSAERGYYVIPAAGFSIYELQHVFNLYKKYAEENGREDMPEKVAFKWIYVDKSLKKARELAEKYFMKTLFAFFQGGEHLYNLLARKLKETWPKDKPWPGKENEINFEILTGNIEYTSCAWGDPQKIIEIMQLLKQQGATMFIGGFNMGAMPTELVRKSMKLFAEKVLPYV